MQEEFEIILEGFSRILVAKLMQNEQKHKFGFSWKKSDWKEQLQRDLPEHVEKGDPRDVAIYAMFAWFHNWPTASPLPINGEGEMEYFLCSQAVIEHLQPTEVSSAINTGYENEAGYKYYVAKLDYTYGDAYYEKVIEPFNELSQVKLDFWYRS